jgi:hypothetical protein
MRRYFWKVSLLWPVFTYLMLLAGCAEFTNSQTQIIKFNRALEIADNQELLLNLIRASRERPMYWTKAGQLQATLSLEGDATLVRSFKATKEGSFTPGLKVIESNQTQINTLQTREFYQNYVLELPKGLIANYNHTGPDPVLYHLAFSKATISIGEHLFQISGDPGNALYRPKASFRDGYSKFVDFLNLMYDAGVRLEHINQSGSAMSIENKNQTIAQSNENGKVNEGASPNNETTQKNTLAQNSEVTW